jgi:hypothetical protein
VAPGDEVSMRIESASEGSVWRWRTEARRAGVTRAAYDQTSADGFPKARPSGREDATTGPRATLSGEVVAWVLDAMDGSRSLLELEAGALERFGHRFTDSDDALQLVRHTAATLGA